MKEVIKVYVTKEEWERVLEKAELADKSMSQFVRDCLMLSLVPVTMVAEPRRAGVAQRQGQVAPNVQVGELANSAEMPTATSKSQEKRIAVLRGSRPHKWDFGHAACYEVNVAHKDHAECCFCKPK